MIDWEFKNKVKSEYQISMLLLIRLIARFLSIYWKCLKSDMRALISSYKIQRQEVKYFKNGVVISIVIWYIIII